MVMGLGKVEEIGKLIAAKQYKKAIELLRRNLQADNENIWLRQQLADVLVLDGQKDLAVAILSRLADAYAQDGFYAKAIAVIKKMQRVDPSRTDLEEKVAMIISQDSQRQRFQGSLRRPEQTRFARLENGPAAPTPAAERAPKPAFPTAPDLPPPAARTPAASIAERPATPEEEELVVEVFGLAGTSTERSVHEGIARSPLFSELSEVDLAALVQGLELLTFEPGEIVVTEGEPGDSLFVLASGRVRVSARDRAGRNHQVRVLDEGEFFGEISLVTGQARTATVTAATPCELLELHRDRLRAIGERHPQVPLVVTDFCDRRLGSREELAARGEPRQP